MCIHNIIHKPLKYNREIAIENNNSPGYMQNIYIQRMLYANSLYISWRSTGNHEEYLPIVMV